MVQQIMVCPIDIHGLIWAVWLEHNRGVYENSSGDIYVVWDSVFYFVMSRSKVDHSLSFLFFHLNIFVVIFDPFSFLMRTSLIY